MSDIPKQGKPASLPPAPRSGGSETRYIRADRFEYFQGLERLVVELRQEIKDFHRGQLTKRDIDAVAKMMDKVKRLQRENAELRARLESLEPVIWCAGCGSIFSAYTMKSGDVSVDLTDRCDCGESEIFIGFTPPKEDET